MPKTNVIVAVVDDDESVRRALQRLLRAAGLGAVVHASGREFLDSLAGQMPDCLVLDVQMPDLSGLDVRDQLASRGTRLPIIFITAHDEPQTRSRALAGEQAGYLRKPFTDEELLNAIESAVRGR